MSYFGTTDFALEVARGNVPGMSQYNKFGRSTDVDTTIRDIWDLTTQGLWVAPTTARLHAIVSTDANDTSAGTGAQTVKIFGLTAWDADEVSEDVIMNGVTPVNTVNSYVIIHRMFALTWGSAGPNVGDITATAATDASITAQVNAGEGQTQMAILGVPSTKVAYVTGYYASVNKGGSGALVDVALKVNGIPASQLAGFTTKGTLSVGTDGTSYLEKKPVPYARFAGPFIMKVTAISSSVNADVSAGFDMFLEDV